MCSKAIAAINILSLHPHDDARVFGRHARSLAEVSELVRIIAPGAPPGTRDGVEFISVPAARNRFETFGVSLLRLLRAHLENPAPIVCITDAALLPLFPVLAALGYRLVYDVHEDYAGMMSHRDWIPRRIRRVTGVVVDRLEGWLSVPAAGILAATNPLLDKFSHSLRTAVYNVPDLSVIERGRLCKTPASRREFDVVHLGVINEARLRFLLEAFERVRARRGSLRALFIGLRPHLHPIVREYFDEGTVHVLDNVPHDEVFPLLGTCGLGVNAHPWLHPHLAVAVPVKVFEYFACGCGLVTSHLPELEGLLLDEDVERIAIVHGADAGRYGDAIADALDDPVALDRNARELQDGVLENYSWERERERLWAFFEDVDASPRFGIRDLRRLLTRARRTP